MPAWRVGIDNLLTIPWPTATGRGKSAKPGLAGDDGEKVLEISRRGHILTPS